MFNVIVCIGSRTSTEHSSDEAIARFLEYRRVGQFESFKLGRLGTFLLPGEQGAFDAGLSAEYESKEHVHAADGKEEECRDKREVVDVVRENSGTDQGLEDTKRTEAKITSKDGEVYVEEPHRPSDFGKDEGDDFENNEYSVHDGPEDSGCLIGNRTIPKCMIAITHTHYKNRQETYSM